jgi:hypothetical protein
MFEAIVGGIITAGGARENSLTVQLNMVSP